MSNILKVNEVGLKPRNEYSIEELAVLEIYEKKFADSDIIVGIGDICINDRGEIRKIIRFSIKDVEFHGHVSERRYIYYLPLKGINNGEELWGEESSIELHDFVQFDYGTKVFGSVAALKADAVNFMINGNTENISEEKVSDSTEIMAGVSKELLESQKRSLLIKRDMMEAKRRYIKSVLDAKTSELRTMVEGFKRQIKKVMRVIETLELFLGIKEELYQIQEGTPADITEPISFRQQVGFMDEEVGDPENGGLDFESIADFDNYLLKYNNYYQKFNYELLIPEKKGVVCLRVRRDEKYYSKNPFINAVMNLENKAAYLLIRNGENIYRIWSENLKLGKKLFPGKTEFMELHENPRNLGYHSQESIDDAIMDYKSQFVMMQGLIDRTQVFSPLPEGINLMSEEPLTKGQVKFIYDNEICLPSERLSFGDWQKKVNVGIEEGSRIFTSGYTIGRGNEREKLDDINARLKRYYTNYYSAPEFPGPGMYTVLYDKDWNPRYGSTGGSLKIVYTATKLWAYQEKERKNGNSFRIYESDSTIINYDAVSLEDIEFYLHNRIDRRHYLSMMPVLMKMKEYKLKEMKKEAPFVNMVVGEIIKEGKAVNIDVKLEEVENKVAELVTWWKLKNKWKRSIESDNTKALRMIVAEFKKLYLTK